MVLRGSYGHTHRPARLADIQGGQTLDRSCASMAAPARRATRPEAAGVRQLRPVLRVVLRRGQLFLGGLLPQEHRQLHRHHARCRRGGSDGDTPFNLHTPVGGAYWNAALAGGCGTADVVCIRNYIFTNFNGQPGVTAGPRIATATSPAPSSASRAIRWRTSASTCRPTRVRPRSMALNSTCSTCSARAASAWRRTTPSSTVRT